MSDVRVGLQVTGDTADFRRSVDAAERTLRDFTAKGNVELDRLANGFRNNLKAVSEFRNVGIKPLADQLGRLSSYELPKANLQLERMSRSSRDAARATTEHTLGIKASQHQLDEFTSSSKKSRDATVEHIIALGAEVRELHSYERSVMSAVAAQKEFQDKADDVTRVLALEAIAAERTAKNLTEKERASLKAALGQKILSEEAEKTARKLLLEAEAADIASHALARNEAGLESITRNNRFGNWFQGFQRQLVAVAVAAGTIAIGPLSAAVADLGVAAIAAGAGLASMSGALAGVASAFGGFIQTMAVIKATGLTQIFASLGQSGDKLRKTLNGLAPEGRAFALTLREVVGPLSDLQKLTSKAMFPGLTAGLKEAAPVVLIVKESLVATAKAIGDVGRDAGRLFGGKDFQNNLAAFGQVNAQGVKALGDTLLHLFDAFLRVERIATPLIKFMQSGMLDAGKAIDTYTKTHGKGLTQFFNSTKTTLSEFFGILMGIGGILKGTFTAVLPVAQQMGRAIEHTLSGWSQIIQSPKGQNALRDFFQSAEAPLGSFLRAVGGLGAALARLAALPNSQKGVTAIFNDLRTQVIPALEELGTIFTKTIPNLLGLLHSVLGLFKDLIPGLHAFVPIIQTLADGMKGIVDALDAIVKNVPGGATVVDTALVAWFVKGKAAQLFDKIKGIGKAGAGIWGSRGPEAPGSAANPISVIGELVGGGIPGGGGTIPGGSKLARAGSAALKALPIVGTVFIAQESINQLLGDKPGNQPFKPSITHPFGNVPGPSARETQRDFQVFSGQALKATQGGNLAQMQRVLKSITDNAKEYPRAKAQFAALTGYMQAQIDKINNKPFTIASNLFRHLQTNSHMTKTQWDRFLKPMEDSLDALPAKARVTTENMIIGMAQAMERKHQLPAGSAKKIHDDLVGRFHDMGVKSVKSAGDMVVGVAAEMSGLATAVSAGISGLGGLLNDALTALGIKHGKMPPPRKVGGDIGKAAGAAAKLGSFLFTGHAQGGWIGGRQRAAQGPDNTLVAAYDGEAFLNHPQQPFVNAALSATKGVVQPYGNLHELFAGTGGRMANGGFASGGRVDGKVSTFGPPGEAGGPTAYGKSSANPGIALNPTGDASGWNGPLANSFGMKWFRTQIGEGAANLQVIDKGPNANNRRIDVTGAGALKMGIPQSRFPTDSIGHAIMVSGPGDTRGGSNITGNLPRMVLGGNPGVLQNLGQGHLDRARAEFQTLLNSKAPNAAAGTDFGDADVSMYAFPLSRFGQEERVDRGQDMDSGAGSVPTLALGAGHIDTAITGFPGMQLTIKSGPAAGQQAFYGHNARPLVPAGASVQAGQPIGMTGGEPFAGAGHTEIGFMPGYSSQVGSWQGPGSRGGMMMHNLLHHGWPGKIGARAMMALGGFAPGGLARAAAKHHNTPAKHKDHQAHPKKARGLTFLQRAARSLGEPRISADVARVQTMENRIADRETGFGTLQSKTDSTDEQSMVSLTDGDFAMFKANPGLFESVTGLPAASIGQFQAGDQVPNVHGGVFNRYMGAAVGDATIAPRGGAFVRGVDQRVSEIGALQANRSTQLAAIQAARHIHSVIIGRAHRAIVKRRLRMKQIQNRVMRNIRRLATLAAELKRIQGKKLDQALKTALSRSAITKRRADHKARLGELKAELVDEQRYQHDQPSSTRDSTHIWQIQDEITAVQGADSADASLLGSRNAISTANLNKTAFNIRGQMGKLEHENRTLSGTGGDNFIMGHGGLWGTLNTQMGNLDSTMRDQQGSRHTDDLAATDVRAAIAAYKSELASYKGLAPIMPRDVAGAGAGATDSTVLADLYKTQLDNALKDFSVSQAEFGVFAGFMPLLQQRLVGSFERGGTIPETGLALVHAGEHVSPAPEGPYGSQIVAQGGGGDTSVVLHMGGDLGPLMKLIDARINDTAPKVVSDQLGRRSRLIRNARKRMASFTLKIGALDLSSYVRMQPGEGFDPADSGGYLEPGFIDTPYFEGQQLSSINAGNRKVTIPLAMHGSANTKDQVHALIQQINQAINATGAIPVEWKDTGASSSSFMNLIFGRLDVDFNYWRAASGWVFGTLHLWVKPYSDTGTTRVVATAAGTGALLTVPIPSIGGDVQPLLDVRTAEGSYFTSQGRMIGLAALPHASYGARVPVASFTSLTGGTLIGASGAEGSQAIAVIPGASSWLPWSFEGALSPASVYAGAAHRVLMPARRSLLGITSLNVRYGGQLIGPTALATAADWALVDLGVLRVPSTAAATITLRVQGAMGGIWAGNPMIPVFRDAPPGAGNATHLVNLGPLIVVPENNSMFITDVVRKPLALELCPPAASVADIRTRFDGLGNPWSTSVLGGAAGFTHYGSDSVWDGDSLQPGWTTGGQTARARSGHVGAPDLYAEMNARNMSASYPLGLFKETGPSMMIEGMFRPYVVGSGALAIHLIEPAGTTLLASQGVAWTSGIHYKFGLRFQGPAIALTMEPNGTTVMATVGASVIASHAAAIYPGQAGVMVLASQTSVALAGPQIKDFRVTALASQAQGASDMYEIDQIGQSVVRTSGANIDNIPDRARGRVRATPSTVAIAVISASMDKGPMNDLVQADIRVRERFFYAR